ncbi:MAG: hypothetical protein A2X12_05930 [Bacteroidetes bacterium GWE2_29_8]|nr:MAG: hypothetical protein A2X12_05930 [Bacteroidetes bacterium GWE2_29_8]
MNKKDKQVIVIGGGIAGMEAASYLSAMGYIVTIVEINDKLGGHLLKWERLFPTNRLGKEVLAFLGQGVENNVKVMTNSEVTKIIKEGDFFEVTINETIKEKADAILLTTGYDLFDATRKEEYGYGIYDNVITSPDLEEMFSSGKEITMKNGKKPKKIGFVHCVGSRDIKVNNIHCSKVCCVTAVKQATEIKEKLPEAEVFCFYMDLRMYGRHFENMYKDSQEKFGVNYIRGRLSEACENADTSILVKVEDTLAGKPLKMSVDLLILLVGFEPSKGTKRIGKMLGIEFSDDGFFKTQDEHTMTNISNIEGVFLAGTCVGPRTITNTIVDARAGAAAIASYLSGYDIMNRKSK